MNIVSQKEVHDLAIEKGWWEEDRKIPELLCLIHSEISEALEGYRKDIPKDKKGNVGEELADAVIRIWDLSEHFGINIIEEVNKKHEYNKTRPYRHGGKKC